MGQPRRFQPTRSARSAGLTSGALPSTTLPEVLEHSTLRLSDIMRSSECIAGEGILVKLFPVSPEHIQSAGDSKRTLWIVGFPNASNAFLGKREDAQKLRGKTTQSARGGSPYERRAKANVTNGKAKGQRLLARGKRKRLTSDERGRGDDVKPDETSDEGEEGAESENDEEVEEGGDGGEEEEEEGEEGEGEAKEGEAEEEREEEEQGDEEGEQENGTENYNAVKDVTTERNAVEDEENEDDAEEQDDDRNDGELYEAQAKEGDKRKDRDDLGEEDKEKDAQDEEEREEGAEGEHEAEEVGDMVEKPSETKEKDDAGKNEQAEGNGDDEEAEEEMGTQDEAREDMEQLVTANNRDGAWRDCRLADMTDKEAEERDTGSGGEEWMAGEENGDHEGRRKRPLETCDFDCPTPGNRPNKRSKSDESESEDGAAIDDLHKRTVNPETTPRPRTPSPTSATASPGSIIEIVRQTSVVPGLENTEKAVWDAAQMDSIISSLPRKQQMKLIETALSLGSEQGIKELRRFVHNARKGSMQESESLEPEFNLSPTQLDFTGGHANNALISRDRDIAHFSTLYRHLDILDGKTTLFSIAKRAKLAAMAQYRKSILPEGASRKDIRGATLRLFHAVWPRHHEIEKPEDKATHPEAYADWIRLRDRLKLGRQWLAVRDVFGGDGAFLALPPQYVSDRDVLKMPSEVLEAWLGLLNVAWEALDDRARQTLNTIVRLALAGQPFPEDILALETLSGTGATPISLSALLTGWSAAARNFHYNKDGATATLMERKAYGDATDPQTSFTTTGITSRIEEAGNTEVILQKDTMGDVSDELFNDLDFDDYLSQEI